jgi:hypothetical protein
MSDAIKIRIEGDASGARSEITNVTVDTKSLQNALEGAGASGLKAGNEIAEGMQKAEYSTMEARHAAMMLGEETGVRIPRALAGIAARSEALGPILAAAFSGIALIAFVELAAKGVEKLEEWITETFIFTSAQKALNEELLSSNAKIADYDKKIKELGIEYEKIGKTGSQLTDIDLAHGTDEILKQQAALRLLADQVYGVKNGMVSLPAAIGTVNGALQTLNPGVKGDALKKLLLPNDTDEETVLAAYANVQGQLQKQLEVSQAAIQNIAKKGGVEYQAEQNRIQEATLTSTKNFLDAKAGMMEAAAKGLPSESTAEIQASTNLEKLAAQQRLAAAKEEIEGKIAIAQQDPTKNAALITQLNGELQTLQENYRTKLLEIDASYYKKVSALQEKQQKESEKFIDEALKTELDADLKSGEAILKAGDAQLKLNEATAKSAAETQADVVARDKAAGHIAQAMQDEQKLIQLLEQQKAAELAIVDAKMAEAQAAMEVAKTSGPGGGLNVPDYNNALAQYREYQAQRITVAAQADKQIAAASDQELKQENTALQTYLQTFNNQFANAFAQVEMGHETMGRTAMRVYDQMATSFLKNMAMAAMAELEGLALHKSIAAQKQLSDAKGAAAGTYNALADIPIIGPVIAPIAAAGAFAAVMAFDEGGMVPSTQMALVHSGESVLTPQQTENFKNMTENPPNPGTDSGSRGGDIHIHAMDASSFQSFLKRNPGALSAGVTHAAKNGHLNVSELARGK